MDQAGVRGGLRYRKVNSWLFYSKSRRRRRPGAFAAIVNFLAASKMSARLAKIVHENAAATQ
jgi:hypothetical protein